MPKRVQKGRIPKQEKERNKEKWVKTTIILPRKLWKEIKYEAVRKEITMSEVIEIKLRELKRLKKKCEELEKKLLSLEENCKKKKGEENPVS